MDRADEALARVELELGLAPEPNSLEVSARRCAEAAITYEGRGDFVQALEFDRKRAANDGEANDECVAQRDAGLNVRYGSERRDHEIGLLRRELALHEAEPGGRRLLTYLIGVILVVFALGGGVFVVCQRGRLPDKTSRARRR